MIRVLVVDDHALVRAGLCRLLGNEDGLEVVGQTGSGHEAVQLCEALLPDLVLLDYSMPEMDGLELTTRIKALEADIPILILTMHANEEYAIRLLRVGASGFIVKGADPAELVVAIRKVSRHQTYISPEIMEKMVTRIGQPRGETPEAVLSNREMQVLIHLGRGATTREVSEELRLSTSTVETYRSRILDKLNLRNNSDMTRFAIRRGLIDLE